MEPSIVSTLPDKNRPEYAVFWSGKVSFYVESLLSTHALEERNVVARMALRRALQSWLPVAKAVSAIMDAIVKSNPASIVTANSILGASKGELQRG